MLQNFARCEKIEDMRILEIYVHIPFCVKKCGYCDFLSAPASEEIQADYLERLLEEINGPLDAGRLELSDAEYEAATVFFGGGTPSILPAGQLVRVLEALRRRFAVREDAEITVEANPGTVDAEKLKRYRASGINRISFGLQSADDRELRALGRIHTWRDFQESFAMARAAGFTNINVDLMSALPGQTCGSWKQTLEKVLGLEPEHISAYSLMLEEGTPFFEKYGACPELLPSEEEERQMYYDTKELLERHGLKRYEISNYTKPGYACRHNIGYWKRREYRGYGLGAASLLDGVRLSNQRKLRAYLEGNFEDSREVLTQKDVREEFFFLGLRMMEGVDAAPYWEDYGKVIEKLQIQGLLKEKDGRICLTERGIDVSNYVFAQFLED